MSLEEKNPAFNAKLDKDLCEMYFVIYLELLCILLYNILLIIKCKMY